MEVEQLQSDPWTLYLYAMKSPVTREKYQKRLGKFLDFLGLEGATIQEKSITFVEMAKKDSNWTFNSILRFVQFQNNRVLKKEITSATVRNYVKSIKLLCEMADLPIAWKKITRGFSKGRRYADDRIPSIEEIKKLVGYPDRRIKAIVYTMASSRIRLGAWDYLHWGDIPDPAVFPEKLPLRCIKLHGVKPDMIVYDPFMGIGTTALACISLGMNYLGTEIDSEYVKVALEDIEKRRRKE